MRYRGMLLIWLFSTAGAVQAGEGVQIKGAKDHIDFKAGGELVARYQFGPKFPRPVFWPLLAPDGVKVTRSWPMVEKDGTESDDHIHQKSAWFCHGDVIPEGIEIKHKIRGVDGVDFWSEAKGHGRIVTQKVGTPKNGSVVLHNEWQTADGDKIMDEKRKIALHDFGKARLLVLDIDLHASACPIIFGDTKEGALGIRVNDQIRGDKKGKGKLTNAEGKTYEKGCWGQISAWCDYSGPIDGKVAGIAVLADPKNPYPTCWHARNYGLMAANPFGRKKALFPATKDNPDLVRLAKGEHLHMRYGILVHSGDCEAANVAEQYQRFVKLREAK
jgi:methane monooxygenase PmoA-like